MTSVYLTRPMPITLAIYVDDIFVSYISTLLIDKFVDLIKRTYGGYKVQSGPIISHLDMNFA